MFWYFSTLSVQILALMWISLMLYSAWVTIYSTINSWLKIIAIPLIFFVGYHMIDISHHMLGTPRFTDEEIQGQLNGYTVFQKDGEKHIAILLTTKEGPRTYAVPYNPSDEKNLSQAMNKLINKGVPTIIRKSDGKLEATQGEGEGDNEDASRKNGKIGASGKPGKKDGTNSNGLEFYEFTEQYLVPKAK